MKPLRIKCNHQTKRESRGFPGLTICFECRKQHYQGAEILRSVRSFWQLRPEVFNFTEDMEREKIFDSLKPEAYPIRPKDFSFVFTEVSKLAERMRLTPSTKFLALFLAKHYIMEIGKHKSKLSENEIKEICHTTIFLSSKIKEDSAHFPLLPLVLASGEFSVEAKTVRAKEIEISQFFNWNFGMMTFYDFIEQFLQLGVLFSSDLIPQKLKDFEPQCDGFSSPSRTNRKKLMQQHGNGVCFQSSTQSELFNSLSNPEKVNLSNYIQAGCLTNEAKATLTEKIERRVLDLVLGVSSIYLTDATVQREVAYLIICAAREGAGIHNYDCELIRQLYKIKLRNPDHFRKKLIEIKNRCPDRSKHLKFDLVIRKYDKEGREVVPPPLVEKLNFDKQILHQALLQHPKYRSKAGITGPPVIGFSAHGMQGMGPGMKLKLADMRNEELKQMNEFRGQKPEEGANEYSDQNTKSIDDGLPTDRQATAEGFFSESMTFGEEGRPDRISFTSRIQGQVSNNLGKLPYHQELQGLQFHSPKQKNRKTRITFNPNVANPLGRPERRNKMSRIPIMSSDFSANSKINPNTHRIPSHLFFKPINFHPGNRNQHPHPLMNPNHPQFNRRVHQMNPQHPRGNQGFSNHQNPYIQSPPTGEKKQPQFDQQNSQHQLMKKPSFSFKSFANFPNQNPNLEQSNSNQPKPRSSYPPRNARSKMTHFETYTERIQGRNSYQSAINRKEKHRSNLRFIQSNDTIKEMKELIEDTRTMMRERRRFDIENKQQQLLNQKHQPLKDRDDVKQLNPTLTSYGDSPKLVMYTMLVFFLTLVLLIFK